MAHVRESGLARLMSREESVTDFLAMLCDLDMKPLRDMLQLRGRGHHVARERAVAGVLDARHRKGRLDLIVRAADESVAAIVEVKLGADIHGDQLKLYREWHARNRSAVDAKKFFISLDLGHHGTPDGWDASISLPELVSAWERSKNPHAAWLGRQAGRELAGRVRQLNGGMGKAKQPVVADLLVKRLVSRLRTDEVVRPITHDFVNESRTGIGAPALLCHVPLPGYEEKGEMALCLDFRASGRLEDRPRLWLLRVGIEVEPIFRRCSRATARSRAHESAMKNLDHFSGETIIKSIESQGVSAECLTAGTEDGFRDRAAGPGALEAWTTGLAAGKLPRFHPVLFHDNGLRLATQLTLDADTLSGGDVFAVLRSVVVYMRGVASTWV